MNEILSKLLEQTPVIIVMGLGLYALWREILRRELSFEKERQAHKAELKERNDYIIERDRETIETMKDISALLDNLNTSINKIL